jgi:hypothetical protein
MDNLETKILDAVFDKVWLKVAISIEGKVRLKLWNHATNQLKNRIIGKFGNQLKKDLS